MIKRNISFYKTKNKKDKQTNKQTNLLQKREFCTKGKVHIMGKLGKFGDRKYGLLLIQETDIR